MDDPGLMGALESRGDRQPDLHHLLPGERPPAFQLGREGPLRHQLHGDPALPANLTTPKTGNDMRMLQPAQNLGFALEPGHQPGLFVRLRRQQLEGNLPVLFRVHRPVHNRHPPRPQLSLQHKGTQLPLGRLR